MELRSSDWAQVKTLFQSMVDMQPSARPGFLDHQKRPQELREILEDLLHAHDEAGSCLDPRGLLAAGLNAFSLPGRIQVGTLLANRFKVIRFCARGSMGEVYEAEDLELRMPVAIKAIRPEIADYSGMLNRFKREVHLAKQVTHPNVCRIFDIFRHHDAAAGRGCLSQHGAFERPDAGRSHSSGR